MTTTLDATVSHTGLLTSLEWDDGTSTAVYRLTIFGRNPDPEPGATAVALRDETLTLSKTHFEIGADDTGAWIRDRESRNGTVVVRNGRRRALAPGVRATLRAGDRLEFGDRSATVAWTRGAAWR